MLCVCVSVCVCMYVCLYVCVYVCKYVCVCFYVCMCVFLLSHYTPNFPLNSTDCQVLVIDAYCVFCEVGYELFNRSLFT